MKMSKKKTEVAVALLILLACIMLYVGVRISALAFLPTCGIWILIGLVYWEKRRAENRHKTKGGKRKKKKPELNTLEACSPPSPN